MHVWIDTAKRLNAIETALMELLEPTAACDLTPKQVNILAALYDKDKQRPTELARRLGILPTSITPILAALERMELTTRRPVQGSLQAVEVVLTAGGLALKGVIQDAVEVVNYRYASKP